MKSEWYKLRKDRIFWVLTLLLLAYSVAVPLEKIGSSINFGENEFYLGHILSVNIEIIVRTIPCILAGFFISSEYSMGTMKSIVSSGNSKIRIYFAKLIIFSIGTIIISLILPIIMTGASAIFLGSNVMPEGIFFLQTIGLISLYAAAFASIMAFFAIIFNDSGKTIGFLFFFFLLFNEVLEFLSERILFLATITKFSPLKLVFNIFNIGQLSNSEVQTLVVAPILTIIIFGILGSFVFLRKEIK
jgi:ABC-2 type transport system permease protein